MHEIAMAIGLLVLAFLARNLSFLTARIYCTKIDHMNDAQWRHKSWCAQGILVLKNFEIVSTNSGYNHYHHNSLSALKACNIIMQKIYLLGRYHFRLRIIKYTSRGRLIMQTSPSKLMPWTNYVHSTCRRTSVNYHRKWLYNAGFLTCFYSKGKENKG